MLPRFRWPNVGETVQGGLHKFNKYPSLQNLFIHLKYGPPAIDDEHAPYCYVQWTFDVSQVVGAHSLDDAFLVVICFGTEMFPEILALLPIILWLAPRYGRSLHRLHACVVSNEKITETWP